MVRKYDKTKTFPKRNPRLKEELAELKRRIETLPEIEILPPPN
jgi:hypothetical protein